MTNESASGDTDVLINAIGIGKKYRVYESARDRFGQLFARRDGVADREHWVLQNISFSVNRGEAVGIVGRNGAGKSTLLQIITGTLAPTTGTISVSGKVAALLQLGSGFNPEFTGRENVYLNGAILGFSRRQISNYMGEILEFAEIGDFIDQPVKTYSSGMTMRLAFAVSTCLEPDLLIVDEALAVGDALFQRKCYARIEDFIERGGSLLFVSHSLETVRRICNRAIYIQDGCVKAMGDPAEVSAAYEFDLDASNKQARKSERPVSRRNEYGNGKARIHDISILDSSGKPVEIVDSDSNFSLTYKVTFLADVPRCVFGFKIMNTEGQVIYATNTHMWHDSFIATHSHQTVKFSFRPERNVLPVGDFFLTVGVSETINGQDHFLHRLVDGAHFRVRTSESGRYFGMVNLRGSVTVE